MMTAFIVAIRGTVPQAVLLGLASTLSRTSVVWVMALIGMHFGRQYDGAVAEPYFQIVSAVLIIAIALAMLQRTWREQRRMSVAARQHAYCYEHDHYYSHWDTHLLAHANDIRRRFAARDVTTGQIVLFSAVVSSGKPDLAWRRFGVVLQHWTRGDSDRSR